MNWERLKAEEGTGVAGRWTRHPRHAAGARAAAKVQRRAAGWGFAWPSSRQAVAALREEVDELAADASDDAEEELGDVLFAAVAVARKLGVDAESALRRTTRGFAERYERCLALARSVSSPWSR